MKTLLAAASVAKDLTCGDFLGWLACWFDACWLDACCAAGLKACMFVTGSFAIFSSLLMKSTNSENVGNFPSLVRLSETMRAHRCTSQSGSFDKSLRFSDSSSKMSSDLFDFIAVRHCFK